MDNVTNEETQIERRGYVYYPVVPKTFIQDGDWKESNDKFLNGLDYIPDNPEDRLITTKPVE